MCFQGQIARRCSEVAAYNQPPSARHASENINVSDLTPLSESGPFILVTVQFLVWGIIFKRQPTEWQLRQWELGKQVTALDVPVMTQSRSLFTETSPDYPNINLTPDSKGTTHKETGKTHIRGDKPFSVCSEEGACLYRCWQ